MAVWQDSTPAMPLEALKITGVAGVSRVNPKIGLAGRFCRRPDMEQRRLTS
jgi:hypothetical protein